METTTATSKPVLTVETTVQASMQKVWECWTKPEHIMQWCHASPDWHAPAATNDLRTGGTFSTTMAAKDGSFSFDFGGTYDVVEENKRIEYTIGDGRKVKITFEQQKDGVKITEAFEAESQNPLDMQQGGWQAILDSYKTYTEKQQ